MTEDISEIVASVLQRDDVDPEADLFRLGMTSLAYVRIVTEINERYGLSLNGSEVDGLASVNRLAAVVDRTPAASTNA